MIFYELTFLLNDKEELKKLKDILNVAKAELIAENDLGEKTLAYPIKKLNTAHFYHWEIKMERKNMPAMRKTLEYNDKIIRFLMLESNKKPAVVRTAVKKPAVEK